MSSQQTPVSVVTSGLIRTQPAANELWRCRHLVYTTDSRSLSLQIHALFSDKRKNSSEHTSYHTIRGQHRHKHKHNSSILLRRRLLKSRCSQITSECVQAVRPMTLSNEASAGAGLQINDGVRHRNEAPAACFGFSLRELGERARPLHI